MKKIVFVLIVVLLLGMSLASANAEAIQNVAVKIDGQIVDFPDERPFIENGRTLVPVRFIGEHLNAVVDWDDEQNSVMVRLEDKEIYIKIDDINAKVNSNIEQLDVPARNQNGRVFVPLRFLVESMGFRTEWEEKTKTVSLYLTTSPVPIEEPQPPAEEISLNPKMFDSKYISTERFEIKDGKIYVEGILAESPAHPNINEQLIKIANSLVREGKYVNIGRNSRAITLILNRALYNSENIGLSFRINTAQPTQEELDEGWKPFKLVFELGRLFKEPTTEYWRIHEEYRRDIRGVLDILIPEDAEEVFNYMVNLREASSKALGEGFRGTSETRQFGNTRVFMNFFFLGGGPQFYLYY